MLARFGQPLADFSEVIEPTHLRRLRLPREGGGRKHRGYERFPRKELYRIPGIRHSRSSFTHQRAD
jgi:hypothetical protein